MKKLLLSTLAFLLISCSTTQPINPVDGKPLVEHSDELTHAERISLQKEMIYRQEKLKEKQEKEIGNIQRQEKYNVLADRFK